MTGSVIHHSFDHLRLIEQWTLIFSAPSCCDLLLPNFKVLTMFNLFGVRQLSRHLVLSLLGCPHFIEIFIYYEPSFISRGSSGGHSFKEGRRSTQPNRSQSRSRALRIVSEDVLFLGGVFGQRRNFHRTRPPESLYRDGRSFSQARSFGVAAKCQQSIEVSQFIQHIHSIDTLRHDLRFQKGVSILRCVRRTSRTALEPCRLCLPAKVTTHGLL